VGQEGLVEVGQDLVLHVVLFACLHHNGGNMRQKCLRNGGEQVVDNLVVQSTSKEGRCGTSKGIVLSSTDL